MRARRCFAELVRAPASWAALLGAAAVLWTAPVAAQGERVRYTVHNLSASGPGRVRAESETEICVFCHTPHGGSDVRPLWNRGVPAGPYRIYESTSMSASVGQPSGSSKLCLSCHDGTIALGSVLSRPEPISMSGWDRMPAGRSNLGTDLGDDHPVSFSYALSSSRKRTELVLPAAIAPPVSLDRNGEVQCTSCHDPHDDRYGDFLVRPSDSGGLCTSCHRMTSWTSSAHAEAPALLGASAADELGIADLGLVQATVAFAACASCHRTHGAVGRRWLLHRGGISSTCVACHDGDVAASDIVREVSKVSSHGMGLAGLATGSASGHFVEGDRISCADCHEPHAAGSSRGLGEEVPASLAGVSGVDISGAPVSSLSHPYELCFRCHGDAPVRVDPLVSRDVVQPNLRLAFQATNPSFHPVGNRGVSSAVPSLIPPLTTASLIGCEDCHDSDASARDGGSGPRGPHGSMFPPLLARRYDTADFSIESPSSYALCYRCHQRDSILRDESFRGHRLHVVDQRTPCSACHDPHGISSAQADAEKHRHLINFDRSLVFPSSSGRLEFVDLGHFTGSCYLSCHGKDHNPLGY